MERNWDLEIDLYTRQGSLKVNYHCSYHEHVLLRLLSRVQTVEIGAEWRVALPGPLAVFFLLTFLCVVVAWKRLTFTQI